MIPLTLLYEDEFFVAIDKPAGMLVHPGREPEPAECIAMKRLRDQLGRRVFPVHRLDRPTSGVLLFALDKRCAGQLQQAFELRSVTKSYLAIVCGIPPERWICETPLQKELGEPFLPATTGFERLSVSPGGSLSLVQANPQTGRFHQIRRHLLEVGFPIVGDFRYAGQAASFQLGNSLAIGTRMLLQARSLSFQHPSTGKSLVIEAPDDPDFLRLFPEKS